MSDHAALDREAIRARAMQDIPCNGDIDALADDVLVLDAALTAAEAELADYRHVSGEQFDYDTLLFKYGEKARDVREYQGYARDLRARVTSLEAAMEQVKAQQPDTLAMIRANGFVFDSIGNEPGNWQHLAFTIYTDLCRVDTIAQSALAKEDT